MTHDGESSQKSKTRILKFFIGVVVFFLLMSLRILFQDKNGKNFDFPELNFLDEIHVIHSCTSKGGVAHWCEVDADRSIDNMSLDEYLKAHGWGSANLIPNGSSIADEKSYIKGNYYLTIRKSVGGYSVDYGRIN